MSGKLAKSFGLSEVPNTENFSTKPRYSWESAEKQ